MSYKVKDHYFLKAKKENFAARSVYKLEEIDQKFKLFKSGQKILDLGAAPGSWSQYASKKVGPQGLVIGIDLTEITLRLPNAIFVQGDMLELDLAAVLKQNSSEDARFDLVISDMAPNTTGIRMTDQARSLELCEQALKVAQSYLKPGGSFICKLFHSDDFKSLKNQILADYQKFEAVKPKSTRSSSKEIFLVGLKKKTAGSKP